MRFARRTDALRAGGKTGWEVHYEALARAARDPEVIVLSQGEHDFETPEPIVDAAVAGLRAGNHHYTPPAGDPALRAAVAERETRRNGVLTNAGEVIIQPGAQGALFGATQCLLDPGDEAILIAPYYVTYSATLRASGARVVTVASDPDAGFALDLDRLEAAVTAKTRLILINSPNNPSGAVYPPAALERIAGLAVAHDLWLVSDEVYAPFAYDGAFVSPRTLPGMAERTVVVYSLSKSHAMTGWRLGWAIGPEPLIERMTDLALVTLYGLPGFIQDAARCALADDQAEARIVERYRRRRDLFVGRLVEKGLVLGAPAGGMNVMLDLRAFGRSSEDLAWRLLEEERVGVLPGDGFGDVAQGFVRASFCTSEARLAEAAARIGRFLQRL